MIHRKNVSLPPNSRNIASILSDRNVPEPFIHDILLTSHIFPLKINDYIVNYLINWNNIPDDPYFRMMFPQREMMTEKDFETLSEECKKPAHDNRLPDIISEIRQKNRSFNSSGCFDGIVKQDGQTIEGLFHLNPGTLLLFPKPAHGCFASCTYCFRWIKEVDPSSHFYYDDPKTPISKLNADPTISNVVFSGGDPLTMHVDELKRYVLPLLKADNVHSICFTTKALGWWPYRFTSDDDADVLIRFFEQINSVKHISIIAHFSHTAELKTPPFLEAITRLKNAGVVIRCQNPLLKSINDTSSIIAEMWQMEIDLGLIPIYLIVEADSSYRTYFKLPFSKVLQIYKEAQRRSSYLAQTVSGAAIMYNSMKLLLMDSTYINNNRYFVLKYLECPDLSKVGTIVFAEYNENVAHTSNLSFVSI